jgi:hypothetical protein
MSKRLMTVVGLVLAVPLLTLALLRMRAEGPQQAREADKDALPEAVANLQRKIDAGKVELDFEDQLPGYLRSVLKSLDIPVSSQVLVFAKNSAQLFLISPETPRAIYFNDDVYVGYVQGAPHLEFASVDPGTGPVFYTLDQIKTDKPQFTLQPSDCFACHDTFQSDRPVSRLLMLSVLSDPKGVALNRSAVITNDKSPFAERWGGWYVSGTHGNLRHMGNRFVREAPDSLGTIPEYSRKANLNEGANVTDLTTRFDTKPYLSPHSDIVALMVLGHQTHVHNLITVATTNLKNNPTEDAIKDDGEPLVAAMLFSDAAALSGPVAGTTTFASEFSQRGPRDSQGRSLHQLDLKTRLLRFPLSYLIYSKSFDTMPKPAKDYVYRRFLEVLSGKDTSPSFAHLSQEDRKAILEILRETKPDFAAFEKQLG